MSELVSNCPRCGTKKITFDVKADTHVATSNNWKYHFESFAICRACSDSTVFRLSTADYALRDVVKKGPSQLEGWGTIEGVVSIDGFVSIADLGAAKPPEHLPSDIESIFNEGAKSLAIDCYNAAGAMFRLCIDMATRPLLPDLSEKEPNTWVRDKLGPRVKWLFDSERLSEDLHELARCVIEDGNDGAHLGSLEETDAQDLQEFTVALLERLYTEPSRLAAAKVRRDERRMPKAT